MWKAGSNVLLIIAGVHSISPETGVLLQSTVSIRNSDQIDEFTKMSIGEEEELREGQANALKEPLIWNSSRKPMELVIVHGDPHGAGEVNALEEQQMWNELLDGAGEVNALEEQQMWNELLELGAPTPTADGRISSDWRRAPHDCRDIKPIGHCRAMKARHCRASDDVNKTCKKTCGLCTNCRDIRPTADCELMKDQYSCNKYYVNKHCKKTCGLCEAHESPRRRAPAPTRRRAPAPTRRRAPAPTRRRAPAPTRRRTPVDCEDIRPTADCNLLKGHYCDVNDYVKSVCHKTCGFCDCRDRRPTADCNLLKAQYCGKNDYVNRVCKKTCGLCQT